MYFYLKREENNGGEAHPRVQGVEVGNRFDVALIILQKIWRQVVKGFLLPESILYSSLMAFTGKYYYAQFGVKSFLVTNQKKFNGIDSWILSKLVSKEHIIKI